MIPTKYPTPNSEACPTCSGGKFLPGNEDPANCPDCRGTGKRPSVCPNSNCHTGHIYSDELSGGLPCPDPFHTSQAPMPGSEIKLKYAVVYDDERTLETRFHTTEKAAIAEFDRLSDEPFSASDNHSVQSFTPEMVAEIKKRPSHDRD